MPGMDIHAALTVVGDGPVGAVGQQLDEHFGLPDGPPPARLGRRHEDGRRSARRLRPRSPAPSSTPSAIPSRRSSASSTCIRTASPRVGIFVPSWFDSPVRTAYRYLQHWMLHPYLWRYLEGRHAALLGRQDRCRNPAAAASRTWPATATRASAKAPAAPTCSPAPAWTKPGPPARSWPRACSNCSRRSKPFTKENLEATYVAAPPRKLGRSRRPRRREVARRLPARRRRAA